MYVTIYQVNPDRDTENMKFLSLDRLQGKQIAPEAYDEVFRGEEDCQDLEQVYAQFNNGGHPLFRGHSLSVSDVVVTGGKAWYCDLADFREIPFDPSKAHRPENLLRVVYVEPGKPAFESDILMELTGYQKAVQGLIELVYNRDGTILVCNDEAKLRGMEGNRHIDADSIIAGPFFVCGDGGEEFRSLTDRETEKYLARFAQPEEISQDEVESDMGFYFISM